MMEANNLTLQNCTEATALLYERLKEGVPGSVITDQELSHLINKDTRPNHPGYSYLTTAINRCRRSGIIWQRIRGESQIKCLNADEIIEASDSAQSRITRTAKKDILALRAASKQPVLSAERVKKIEARATLMQVVCILSNRQATERLIAGPTPTPINEYIITERLLSACTGT